MLPSLGPLDLGRSTKQETAREDPSERLARLQAMLATRAEPEPRPQRWPKLALVGACLAALAAGWWVYRDNAGDRSERTIAPALAGEVPADRLLEQERKRNADLERQLASREKDDSSLVQEQARTKDLKEQLAMRQNDEQSLTEARERIKALEQQVATSKQPPPLPVPQPAAAEPVFLPPEVMPKPQTTVRRSGPRPLPKATQPMPRLSLLASNFDSNPSGYWQVTATLVSNTSRAVDARVQCSFQSAGRSIGEAEFGPTSVAPGEQVSAELFGPPTTANVDSATCRLVGQ